MVTIIGQEQRNASGQTGTVFRRSTDAIARQVTAASLGVLANVMGVKACDSGIPVTVRIWRIRGALQASMVGPYQFHNLGRLIARLPGKWARALS